MYAAEAKVPADGIGATDYAESGDYEDMLKKYGYNAENFAAKAKEVIASAENLAAKEVIAGK